MKEAYLKVGKIHQEICTKAKPLVTVGTTYLELAKQIEQMIRDTNASLAFPVNIQPNNEVHYTPIPNDMRKIEEGDTIKVDIGLHIDGYIADGAFTVSFNKDYDDMVIFTEKILAETLKDLKPGMKISEIGKRLDEQMKGSEYKIIKNLMGHQLHQGELHGNKSVKVYEERTNDNTMDPGDAFAVEIFVTDGDGMMKAANSSTIYAMKDNLVPTRDTNTRKLAQIIFDKRGTFPFSERYVTDHLKYSKMDFFKLKQSGNIISYPLLLERKGSKIVQFEDVIYVDNDDVIITTKQNI